MGGATVERPEARGSLARIGAFELDLAASELRRSGRLVALTGQPMRVLIRLVERAGAIVTRDELQRELWGDNTHVDFEAGLSTCVNQVRGALGDRAGSPRFVETLPRRGYRFVAPVQWEAGPVDETDVPPAVEPAAVAATAVPAGRPGFVRGRRLVLAVTVAAASIAAVSVWSVGTPSVRSPVPTTVMVVDVDPETRDLRPVARSLTDALIGAVASEAGVRARVLSPLAARDFDSKPLHEAQDAGIDYVVLVTLRPLGGPVLVHVKLVGPGGWVRWTSDRAMTVEELERAPLRLAEELSKPLVQRITSRDAS